MCKEPVLKNHLLDSARAGMDFLVRTQMQDIWSADYGRFPFEFDAAAGRAKNWSMNWGTGIGVDALLCGYRAFHEQAYLDSAKLAVEYMKSLQVMDSANPAYFGTFREYTPVWDMVYPRDALTSAMAMLTWVEITGDEECGRRVDLFADWFCRVAMLDGYPQWTVSLDPAKPSIPEWYGSFHSGSALFFARMLKSRPRDEYCDAMCRILDHYNRWHLNADGSITVVRDRKTNEALDGKADPELSPREWEIMHVYNDDFGALANLSAWRLTGKDDYADAARRYLRFVEGEQRSDGGFGPEEGHSIHSAGGTVLLEMLAAKSLGFDDVADETVSRAAQFLLDIQMTNGSVADGGFIGYQSDYTLNPSTVSLRSTAYAITAFLYEYSPAHLAFFNEKQRVFDS